MATVTLGGFTGSDGAAAALIYMDRVALDFRGYPENNEAVGLDTLYAVDCMAGAFHRATYRVRLASRPRANVTVSVAPSDARVSATPRALTWSPAAWNESRAVGVCATTARDAVAPFAATLTHNASSADALYDSVAVANASLRVRVRADGVPPPELASARFWNSGAGADVAFDRETNLAGLVGVWPCGALFNVSARFGDAASWTCATSSPHKTLQTVQNDDNLCAIF